ncbi:MAG: LamG-like jellyroll fold domain-containing protein [Promethearchaeota archaeon]
MQRKYGSILILGIYCLSYLLLLFLNGSPYISHSSIMNSKEVNPLHKRDTIKSIPRLIFPNPHEVDENNILPSYNPHYDIHTPYFTSGWGDSRWKFRKNITIPAVNINEDLIDFPLYMELLDSELQQWARTDGQDIMFADSSGTQLAHELVQYRRLYNDTHAQLNAWVKTNLSASDDNVVSLYFGNPLAKKLENTSALWDAYNGVWHLDDDLNDSTQYLNHGISQGTTVVEGKILEGRHFGSANYDQVDCGSDTSLDDLFLGEGGTIEVWVYFDQFFPYGTQYILSKGYSNYGWTLFATINGDLKFTRRYTVSESRWAVYNAFSPSQWHHIAITLNGTVYTNDPVIYIDGTSCNVIQEVIRSNLPSSDAAYDFLLGNSEDYGAPIRGRLDEARAAPSIFSAERINTGYTNQYAPASFYIISSTEQNPKDDWIFPALRYRKPITIHGNQISGTTNLTDVPVLLDIYDADLNDSTLLRSDGNGLEFAFANGTKAKVELEIFNQTYNTTHAHLVAWVGVPSLGPQDDLVLYMYYGNTVYESETITWDYYSSNADFWDANYYIVWHLEDGSGSYLHSSVSYLPLRCYSSPPIERQGKIGLCIEGEEPTSDERYITNTEPLFPDNFTMEAWIKPDVVTGEQTIVSRCNLSAEIQLLFFINGSQLQVILPPVLPEAWGNVTIEPNVWQHVALMYNGTGVGLYKNGILLDSITVSNDPLYITDDAYDIWVASTRHSTMLSHMRFDGLIDELRLSRIAHSGDWLATTYITQANPESFCTVGVQENYRWWWADGTFICRKDLILDGSNMWGASDETYVNFPFLIDIYDSDLHDANVVQATGADILFTTPNGTKLHHEILVFDQNYNSTHAHLQGWIQIPFFRRYNHIHVVMYYYNDVLEAQETPMVVWENYRSVWHMEEDPTGTVPQLHDASPSQLHGIANTTMTSDDLVTGHLGSGWRLNDVGDNVNVTHPTLWDFVESDELHISAWIYLYEFPKDGIVIWGDLNGPRFSIYPDNIAQNVCVLIWQSGGNPVSDDFIMPLNQWHYVEVRRSWATSPRVSFMVNGDTTPTWYPMDTSVNPDLVGMGFTENASEAFNGIIDEVRIAVNRDEDITWLRSAFDNQEHPEANVLVVSPEQILNDSVPAEIVVVGVDDSGTGAAITFWAQVVDDISGVEAVTLRLNGTDHAMTFNGSIWIYSQPINWGEYYTYQISNASDVSGNFIAEMTTEQQYTCTYDIIVPTIVAWEYDPEVGQYGAFRANASDTWGLLDTVLVNVTEAEGVPRNDLWAIMVLINTNWQFINNTLVLPPGTFYFDILVNDTYGNIRVSANHQGFAPSDPSNDPPSVGNLTLSRSTSSVRLPIYSNCTMFLAYDFYDPDNDSEGGTEIRWYKNSFLQSAYNDLKAVPESALMKTDQWYATVRPKDGQDFGTRETSPTVTIQNTPPVVTNVMISPSTAYTTDDLVAIYTFSDHDGDTEDLVSRLIIWYKNGILQGDLNGSLIVNAGKTTKNDLWHVRLCSNDGTDFGKWIGCFVNRTIENTTPLVLSVQLNPSNPQTQSNLSVNYSYFDMDNDAENGSLIHWYKNGILQPPLTNALVVNSGNITKGETWYVIIRPSDEDNMGLDYQSSSVIIENTAPTITGVNINPNPACTTSFLRAHYEYIDLDNDFEYNTLFYWYCDGNLQFALMNSSIVPSGYLIRGQEWALHVQPNDGTTIGLRVICPTNITIQNSIPQVINEQYQFNDIIGRVSPTGKRMDEFYVEDEDLVVSYDFLDADLSDIDRSRVQWFRRTTFEDPWIEMSAYENSTVIPAIITAVSDEWYYQITPFDMFDTGEVTIGEIIVIESRPIIHSYQIVHNPMTETQLKILVGVTNSLHDVETVECNFLFQDGTEQRVLGISRQLGNWSVLLEIEDLNNLNTEIMARILAFVLVPNTDLLVMIEETINFTLLDKAAPRVRDAFFILNNEHIPTEITFYAKIEEYGSGVENVILNYYFDPVSGGTGAAVFQSEQSVLMIQTNQTNDQEIYTATVLFQQNESNWRVIYRIKTQDKAGNINPIAFDILADPSRVERDLLTYTSVGLPPMIVMVLIITTIMVAIFGSLLYMKFIRKPKIVGLDTELILSRINKIDVNLIQNSLNYHSLGIVISFFDQRHGPIPIIVEPEILKDNFLALVRLSDQSFSSCGFVKDFTKEKMATFDFEISSNTEFGILSYAFSLNRPEARGGIENITLNILIYSGLFSLVNQFSEEILPKIHEIHILMDNHPTKKDEIIMRVRLLRQLISGIILSYERVYGTTELLDVEEDTYL